MITGQTKRVSTDQSSRPRPLISAIAVAVLCGVTLAAFWPTLDNGFLNWDDDRNFLENEAFRCSGLPLLRWAWSTYHMGVWQPLSWCLLSIQYAVGGLDPTVYHAASLFLHVVNVVVLYYLVLTVLRTADPRCLGESPLIARLAAAAAVLLFAIHPLRVEAVTWLSCQPYLPAVLFFMLGVLCHLRGRRVESGPNRRAWLWWLATFAFYLLAVMSKAAAVTLPAVLLLVDIYPLRRFSGRSPRRGREIAVALVEKLPFFVVAVIVSAWAAQAKDFSETRVPFALAALPVRAAQSVYGLMFYLFKTVLPLDLIPYYELPTDLDPWTWLYAECAGIVLAVTVALFCVRHRWPGAIIAWLAYVLILLPNLGLVQIGQQIAADRYSYLATVPLVILLAAGLLRVLSHPCAGPQPHGSVSSQGQTSSSGADHPRALCLPSFRSVGLIALIAAAVVALTFATRRQTRIWHDSISLWEATLAVDPKCAVAECNLATALVLQGRHREASLHLSRAIELKPWFGFAYANLGVLLLDADVPEDAAIALEHALKYGSDLSPRDLAKVHAGLGQAYAALRHTDLAWKHTRAAQRLGFKKADKMIEYLRQFSTEPTE